MFRWGQRATVLAILSGSILGGAACAQPTTMPSFDSASVKVSQSSIGHEGTITTGPEQLTARNVTLKRLVFEAWQAPYDRLTGGASGCPRKNTISMRERPTRSVRRISGRC